MKHSHLTHDARREMIEAQLDRCNNPDLADVVERNIGTILKLRRREEASRGLEDRVADAITWFSGSMKFVYLHAVVFALWIIINSGRFGVHPFDPFPYNLLTMTVSLEAIFLSTFVLVSQNRMAATADKRADLDLQINLLAEHEITRLLVLTDAIVKHLDIALPEGYELGDLSQSVAPDTLLKEIAERERESRG